MEPEDQCAQDGITVNGLIKGCLFRLQFSLERLVKQQSLAAGFFSHQRYFFISEEKESKGKRARRKNVDNRHTVANLASREGYSLLPHSFSASVW